MPGLDRNRPTFQNITARFCWDSKLRHWEFAGHTRMRVDVVGHHAFGNQFLEGLFGFGDLLQVEA